MTAVSATAFAEGLIPACSDLEVEVVKCEIDSWSISLPYAVIKGMRGKPIIVIMASLPGS